MIITPRLYLYDADQTIWEAYLEGKDALARVLGANVPKKWTENADAFPIFIEMCKADPDLYEWGAKMIVYRPENLLIGSCGFKGKPNETGQVEIGYEIKPSHRNKGLAFEAAKGLVDFAFKDSLVKEVIAHTLPIENHSTKILQKLGFQQIGTHIDPDNGEVWKWQRHK